MDSALADTDYAWFMNWPSTLGQDNLYFPTLDGLHDVHETITHPPNTVLPDGAFRQPQRNDWDSIRAQFTNLYQTQGLKLKEIMEIMKRDRGFCAPMHSYKKKITAWGLGKTFKKEEKARLAAMAQRSIAAGQTLPDRDEIGRVIPWHRIQRQIRQDNSTKNGNQETSSLQVDQRENQNDNVDSGTFTTIRSPRLQTQRGPATPSTRHVPGQQNLIISPSPNLTDELHSTRSMFYCADEFYAWCSVTGRKKDAESPGVYLSLVYRDTRTKMQLCPPQERQQLLIAAAEKVAPFLRFQNVHVITDVLLAIHEAVRHMDWPCAAMILQLFAATSQEECGRHHPLTRLLRSVSKAAGPAFTLDSIPTTAPKTAIDLPLVELIEHCKNEVKESDTDSAIDTDAVYATQDDLFRAHMTADEAQEAERPCRDLIAWSAKRYGPQHPCYLRARRNLADLYMLQGSLNEAQMLLEELWALWTHERDGIGEAAFLNRWPCWSPAWRLASLCETQGKIEEGIIYSNEAFTWYKSRFGKTHSYALANLELHMNFLKAKGDAEAIDALALKHPEPWEILKAASAENNESLTSTTWPVWDDETEPGENDLQDNNTREGRGRRRSSPWQIDLGTSPCQAS